MVVVKQLRKGGRDMVINLEKENDNYIIRCDNETNITINNKQLKSTDIYAIFKELTIEQIEGIVINEIGDNYSEEDKSLLNELKDILVNIQQRIVEIKNSYA